MHAPSVRQKEILLKLKATWRSLFVALFLYLVPILTADAESGSEGAAFTTTRANNFLKALLSQQESLPCLDRPLDREERKFLYTSRPDDEWKSVLEIAKMGDLAIRILPQGDKIFTVLYVPKKYIKYTDDPEWLSSQWMKKYFACEFKTYDGICRLHVNVCFAETDGPFPGY